MVLDAGRAGNHAAYAREGPHVRGEAGGLGAAQERGLHAVEGGIIQPWPSTGATSGLEGGPSVTTPSVMPAAGGLTTDMEAVDHGCLVKPLPKQFGGSESASFQSWEIPTGANGGVHTPRYHIMGILVTLLGEAH
jgi:hypothetical protein